MLEIVVLTQPTSENANYTITQPRYIISHLNVDSIFISRRRPRHHGDGRTNGQEVPGCGSSLVRNHATPGRTVFSPAGRAHLISMRDADDLGVSSAVAGNAYRPLAPE